MDDRLSAWRKEAAEVDHAHGIVLAPIVDDALNLGDARGRKRLPRRPARPARHAVDDGPGLQAARLTNEEIERLAPGFGGGVVEGEINFFCSGRGSGRRGFGGGAASTT